MLGVRHEKEGKLRVTYAGWEAGDPGQRLTVTCNATLMGVVPGIIDPGPHAKSPRNAPSFQS